jgi:hypothetical protein
MSLITLSLIPLLMMLGACARVSDLPKRPADVDILQETTQADEDILSWDSCNPEQAERWAMEAEGDGRAAMMAANCYAVLVRQGYDQAGELEYAKRGRQLAETAVGMLPGNGVAHYLAAYLTGLEAEREPLRGLELVPIIENEALLAADLSPWIDQGGPDRMLGELYLRAPGFPVSVGDSTKAAIHYRRALAQAPGFAPNRQGLVKALLAEGRPSEACMELSELFSSISPSPEDEATWDGALELLKDLCSGQPEDKFTHQ